jgi:hypothetical protein
VKKMDIMDNSSIYNDINDKWMYRRKYMKWGVVEVNIARQQEY